MSTQIAQAPYVQSYDANIPAEGATTDSETVIVTAPFAGIITGATYTPNGAETGAATNNRAFAIQNETQGVQAALLTLVSGTNLVAFAKSALALSGTAANLAVNAGDVLTFKSVHAGTGIADPGGLVTLTISGVDTGDAIESPYYETPATYPTGSDNVWNAVDGTYGNG